MREPRINDLLAKVDNKYSLILVVSKRAREIIDGGENTQEPMVRSKIQNPVTIATKEVAEGRVVSI
jgi:DNA-directed RNA polymerase subunit omega